MEKKRIITIGREFGRKSPIGSASPAMTMS